MYEASGRPCTVGQLVYCSKVLFKRVQGLKSKLLITSQFTWGEGSFRSSCRLLRKWYIFLIHAKVLCRLLASMKARSQGLPLNYSIRIFLLSISQVICMHLGVWKPRNTFRRRRCSGQHFIQGKGMGGTSVL